MLYKRIIYTAFAAYSVDGMVTTKMLRGGDENDGTLPAVAQVVADAAAVAGNVVAGVTDQVKQFAMSQSAVLEEALLNLQEAQKEIKAGIAHLDAPDANGMIAAKENLDEAKVNLGSVINVVGKGGVTGNEEVKSSVEMVQRKVLQAIQELENVGPNTDRDVAKANAALAIMKEASEELVLVTANVQGLPGQAKVCEAMEEAKTEIQKIVENAPGADVEVKKVQGAMDVFIAEVKKGAGNNNFIDRQEESELMQAEMDQLQEKLKDLKARKNANIVPQGECCASSKEKLEEEKAAAEAKNAFEAAQKKVHDVINTVKISVKKYDEEDLIRLEVYPIDLVRDVKTKINSGKEIPPDQQILRFEANSESLTDGSTLAECGITEEVVLVYESHEGGSLAGF